MLRLNATEFFLSTFRVFRSRQLGPVSPFGPFWLWLAMGLAMLSSARAQQADFDPCQPLPVLMSLNAEFFQAGAEQQSPSIPLEFQNLTDTVSVRADSREITREFYRLHGHVEVTYQKFKLVADDAVYNRATDEVTATGHVTFTDSKAYLEANEVHYNLRTQKGWFANGHGYLHAAMRPGAPVVSSENPLYVQAGRVDRLDENTYSLEQARVSSCENEDKGWSLSARSARVQVNDRVVTHGAVFRLLNVPILYLPVMVSSIAPRPRQTGFLLPHIGNSSQKGYIVGDGFFWDINRSADLLVGLEDYSNRGLARSAQFRAKPSPTSDITVNYYGINDRGLSGPGGQLLQASGNSVRAVGQAGNVGYGFRGVLDVDYISSLAFRQTWSNSFTEAVSSEARQTGFLTRNFDAYSVNLFVSRYQNFLCAVGGAVTNGFSTSANCPPGVGSGGAAGNSITIRQMPSFSASGMDKQVGRSPFYFSFDASADGVGRTEPGFSTPAITDRFDVHPEILLRTKPFWGFHVTPTLGFDATHYGTSLRPDHSPVNRIMGDFSVDLQPPSFEKVLQRTLWGYRLKHVVEPDIRYRLVRASDREDIDNIVRYDLIDIFSETNEIEYSLTNTLMARKNSPDGSGEMPPARDFLSLRLSQKYYFDPTFGGALVSGQNVVWDPTISLTGFAFAQGRRLSPVVSVLKMAPSSNYDTEMRADFNPNGGGVLNAGITSHVHRGLLGLAFTDFFINRTAALLTPLPPTSSLSQLPSFNLLRTVATFGDLNHKGFSGAFGMDYNFAQGIAQQLVSQASYNFGCFGIDVEYRRFALGTLRQENSYRIALSLSNIGTFGNLKTRERLY